MSEKSEPEGQTQSDKRDFPHAKEAIRVDQHIVEILSDSGEGAQTAGHGEAGAAANLKN